MKNLSKYIQNLNFDYAISYSGLRGDNFRELEENNNEVIKTLKIEIESARFMQKFKLNREVRELEREIDIYNSRIITNKSEVHKSTVMIHEFEKGDKELIDLLDILSSKFDEQHFWVCPPIFRDAIVFYSKQNEIKGILQICFSCSWIKDENDDSFEVDYRIFPKLKDKLVQIGHQIENDHEPFS